MARSRTDHLTQAPPMIEECSINCQVKPSHVDEIVLSSVTLCRHFSIMMKWKKNVFIQI